MNTETGFLDRNVQRTVYYLAKLAKVSARDHLGLRRIARFPYPPNIQRPVLSTERPHATHVVSVVGELFTRKAVFGGIGELAACHGQPVQVVAFIPVRAAPTREEEAAVFHPRSIGAREAAVLLDVTPSL